MPSHAQPLVQTSAAVRYGKNIKRLLSLIEVVNTAWKPIINQLEDVSPKVPTAVPGDEVDKKLDILVTQGEAVFTGVQFAFEWYVVIIVTMAEAYLEDVLAAAAALDPKLMEKSEQRASYAEVIDARSLEHLADSLRHRWARNFIEDGGPSKWISRLNRMGLTPLTTDNVRKLEELWGLRHTVVHRVGVVDAEFVSRHPQLGHKAGDALSLSRDNVLAYFRSAGDIVGAIDSFFLKRIPALASGSTKTE